MPICGWFFTHFSTHHTPSVKLSVNVYSFVYNMCKEEALFEGTNGMKKYINIFRIQSWCNIIKILIIVGAVFLTKTGYSEFTMGEEIKCRN